MAMENCGGGGGADAAAVVDEWSAADTPLCVFWTAASAWTSLSRPHTCRVLRPNEWPNDTWDWPFDWTPCCKSRTRTACRLCVCAYAAAICSGSWRSCCKFRMHIWCWIGRCFSLCSSSHCSCCSCRFGSSSLSATHRPFETVIVTETAIRSSDSILI